MRNQRKKASTTPAQDINILKMKVKIKFIKKNLVMKTLKMVFDLAFNGKVEVNMRHLITKD